MRTQELIHPAAPTRTLWNSAPRLLAPWTTEQILDQVTTCALAEKKKDRYESLSTGWEPFRQTCIREVRIPDAAYRQIALTDFSHSVLELATNSLLAFRLNNIEWNDLGDSYRVLAALFEKQGELPGRTRRRPAGDPTPSAAWATA